MCLIIGKYVQYFKKSRVTIGARNVCFSALVAVHLGQNVFGIIDDF